MTPYLSAALQLVVKGDPHNDLPAAIEWLAEDDQRAVRSLLDAQQKRIKREVAPLVANLQIVQAVLSENGGSAPEIDAPAESWKWAMADLLTNGER